MQKANKKQIPHIVFHFEGETEGEFVTVSMESHAFGETATIAQLFGRAWAKADKLTAIRIDHVSVEIGMCDGGEDDGAEDGETSPAEGI